ncbi:phosphatase PAP2 family protein [Cupriavidus taiwanensis]|uniref:Putative phosphatase n=1 Tax=Cupriavidus taiwanensis TaxID=164546 RepID=A0A375INZ9_9BURK|nr:phosphatase PAP2 family protein [Cupriavidus taiwanensis]SOY59623.1 Putative phosphatase [Cupriavidus taiwanensis]SOY60017.1 Putative phosphatase [Cupriavidus taiwanensis]SOY92140.1 Putative phosphatase [Cupriavidus taiwanensis]SOZ26914.1 Putative phosphatase [Cupriavidus taiwanensis]SOZ65935.1 Putative phosphatase [Cupriavidus taiwanensis]
MSHWHLVSLFGESAYLLPCAVFLALWLYWRGAPGSARHWVLAFAAAALLVLASKLAFMGWGIGSAALNFTGFSGHAMMAASVLPVLLYLAVPAAWRRLGWLAAAAGVGLALLVGVSRLALHAHSVSEVAGGLGVGLCVSLPFILRRTTPHGPLAMVLASVVLASALVMPMAGTVGASHALIQQLAMLLSGRDRPFQRGEWAMHWRLPGYATVHAAVRTGPG